MNRKYEINKWYTIILGRSADCKGLLHYTNSNLSIDKIKTILLSSEEYKERNLPYNKTKLNKQWALDNLIELDIIFKKYNVKFWLDSGTLLGYYRNKDFISHDHDVDIGVNFLEFNPKIIFDIYSSGWKIKTFGTPNNSLHVRVTKRSIEVDIFFYYPITDNKVKYSVFDCDNIGLKQLDYIFNKFNIKKIEFLGNNFYVPEDELDWIITHYGTNWNVEICNWDWKSSPLNLKHTGNYLDKTLQTNELLSWASDIPMQVWGI